jgi:hypothetical protein
MNQPSGKAAGGYPTIGIPQADGVAQVDEEVGGRHRRDVHPAVARHAGQAVDVVDEPVERRGGDPADVSMDPVWMIGKLFTLRRGLV